VPFSLSESVDQSGLTSSAFVEVIPKAREASWPAKTVELYQLTVTFYTDKSLKDTWRLDLDLEERVVEDLESS